MNKMLDVFCEIQCLTEQKTPFRGVELQRKWFKTADRRYIGETLQKFISYNSTNFAFLGVEPNISGSDRDTSISFRSNAFVGAIPLRAPDTGKQIGDFVVSPRYFGRERFENFVEILDLLDKDIKPESKESLPLASGRNFRPPLYLEAVKFIYTLEELLKSPWRKFNSIEKVANEPVGQVNWEKYVSQEFKVERRLKFLTRRNILSEYHQEYSELKYVFDICKKELLSSNTPIRIKSGHRNRILMIEEKLNFHKSKQTENVRIRASDTPIIIQCKEQANKILSHDFSKTTAWRVDFSDVFEKYVQYIFKEVSREIGGIFFSNVRFPAKSSIRYEWELHHIEPDGVYKKNNLLIFIDAKYKSNLYNKYSLSERLRTDFRYDLHQILAYSSFSKLPSTFGFLCYPSNELEIKKTIFTNEINKTINTIFICGFPFRKSIIHASREILSNQINNIENSFITAPK